MAQDSLRGGKRLRGETVDDVPRISKRYEYLHSGMRISNYTRNLFVSVSKHCSYSSPLSITRVSSTKLSFQFSQPTTSRDHHTQHLRVVREHLGEEVGPRHAGEPPDEPAGGELGPPVRGLHGVAADVAAGQGLDADHLFGLERGRAVDGEARGEDDHEAGAGEAPREFRGIRGTQRAELDERPGEEEAVREADLDATGQGGDAGAVRGQVGQEVRDNRRGCHGGFEHADEGIAVDGFDHLRLVIRRGAHGERSLLGTVDGIKRGWGRKVSHAQNRLYSHRIYAPS